MFFLLVEIIQAYIYRKKFRRSFKLSSHHDLSYLIWTNSHVDSSNQAERYAFIWKGSQIDEFLLVWKTALTDSWCLHHLKLLSEHGDLQKKQCEWLDIWRKASGLQSFLLSSPHTLSISLAPPLHIFSPSSSTLALSMSGLYGGRIQSLVFHPCLLH